MSSTRALDIALGEVECINLADCKSMQEYLNKHVMYQLDIKEAGGTYTDQQLISKLIRGLGAQYDCVVDQYYFLQDTGVLEDVGINNITSRFPTFESKMNERNPKKSANMVDKKGGKFKKRVKCPVDGCKKWGHIEEACWVAHPELKKKKIRRTTIRTPTAGRAIRSLRTIRRRRRRSSL
jgi:hypothetical protein